MAFNPFNLFKGNPKVLELMAADRPLDQLLLQQAFVSEFKKSDNEALQNYMNYERYSELITFITTIDPSNTDKNRTFKFPYVASEVLSVNNELTYKFLLEEVVFTEEQLEEEVQIEKQVDSDSDRSYSSIKSNNSINSNRRKEAQLDHDKAFEEADKENFVLREEGDKNLSQMDFKEISEDDFPEVKQRRVVTVREKVMRTVKKPFQPLIFRLLKFFSSEVVHILDGYVCRVLQGVINNRLQVFLGIIDRYSASNQLKRIFSHLQSTSVQDFLLSFITRIQQNEGVLGMAQQLRFIDFIQRVCEIGIKEWPQQESVLEEKAYLLSLYCAILQKINSKLNSKLNPEGEAPQQSKPIAAQLKQLAKVLNKEHLSKIVDIAAAVAVKDNSQSYQMNRITINYAKLIKLSLKGFSLVRTAEIKIEGKEQQSLAKAILQSCEDCFDRIIPACFSFIFEDYLQAQHPQNYRGKNPLLGKVQFLDVLAALSKENIFFSRRSIADHPCCPYLLSLMDQYPKSSIMHNSVHAIVSPFLAPDCPPLLTDKFFHLAHLLSFLYQTVKNDYQARFERKQKIQKCYMAQLSSLCLSIERLDSDSDALMEYKQSYEWQFIRECLIQDEKVLRKKGLGGHEKLRDRKPLIFFSKQQCLDHYKHFLSGLKLNSFEDFENYEPGNSDSQDEKDKQYTVDMTAIESIEEEREQMGHSQVQDDSKYFAEDYTL